MTTNKKLTFNKIVFSTLFIVLGLLNAQSNLKSNLQFEQYDFKSRDIEIKPEDQPIDVNSIPQERPVDPDRYLVGPGDRFGINIISTENIVLEAIVGPTGDLLIPAVGVVSLSDHNLTEAVDLITQSVYRSYKNSIVNVALVSMRIFKVHVTGAVNSPGFVRVTPVDRLMDIVRLAGGLHKYADENSIHIRASSGEDETVSLRKYYLNGSLSDNPMISMGQDVFVPFQVAFNTDMRENITANATAVLITGHVNFPGPYRFITGNTAEDYIGVAGGLLVSGTMKKLKIIRNGNTESLDATEYILPGDQIIVGETIKNMLFGEDSILGTIRNIATIYLSYKAATRK